MILYFSGTGNSKYAAQRIAGALGDIGTIARIKESHLTRAHRQIAEFCLQNKQSLPLLSTAEIARQTGVSDVSVIRFVRSLGYASFVEFKHEIQAEIASTTPAGPGPSPIVRYVSKQNQPDSVRDSESAKAVYLGIVEDIFSRNPPSVFERAAKLLLNSRNRYIFGTRFRHGVAEICTNLLRMTTPNIHLMPVADYAAFQVAMDFTQDDCLLWFCFGRHTNFEKQILQYVRRSGIHLIVVTDQRASAVALEADLLIQSVGHTTMPFYSSMANCIIAEQIANAVVSMGWVGTEGRLRDYEQSLNTMAISDLT